MTFEQFMDFPLFSKDLVPIAKTHLLKVLQKKLHYSELWILIRRMAANNDKGRWILQALSSPACLDEPSCMAVCEEVCAWGSDQRFQGFKLIPFCLEFKFTQQSYSAFLHEAIGCGKTEYVEMLLEDGRANPTKDSLLYAHSKGHFEIMKLLLEDGRSDPSYGVSYILRQANEARMVKLLLDDGRADPKPHKSKGFLSACADGHLSVVKLILMDGRADIRGRGNDALQAASRNGHELVVQLLLASGKLDPKTKFCRALRVAESYGNSGVVRVLLQDDRISRRCKVSASLL
ncbi:MAG: hypothetical protein SGCHY_000754, partial [Lobulomycetales sp.]